MDLDTHSSRMCWWSTTCVVFNEQKIRMMHFSRAKKCDTLQYQVTLQLLAAVHAVGAARAAMVHMHNHTLPCNAGCSQQRTKTPPFSPHLSFLLLAQTGPGRSSSDHPSHCTTCQQHCTDELSSLQSCYCCRPVLSLPHPLAGAALLTTDTLPCYLLVS